MTIYAIGDVQGCYDALRRLLDVIEFNPEHDQLWFAGDLVNRGPQSLETLRFVKSLGEAAKVVLGNHDLHLIASTTLARPPNKKDTWGDLLAAADCDELIHWLRHQKLFYYQAGFAVLHAGLPPQWDLAMALKMAAGLERVIQSDDHPIFFKNMYGNKPTVWYDGMSLEEQLRFAVNCFTRLRYCTRNGILDFSQKGPPGSQPTGLLPWFAVPERKSQDLRIIFGHWSSLGFYQGYNCHAIDTGCVWGGQLTALKLGSEPERISIHNHGAQK
jgi:bis(5'-nucleosyl)-tetraphosphatase (symmetrical)